MAARRRCPICKQPVPARSEHAPFCSGRCRDVDLGTWLGEGYRLSRPMTGWELERAYGETDALESADRSPDDR